MEDWRKMYFNALSINGTEFSAFIDTQFKKLHILDRDAPGSRSVTNAIGGPFLLKLFQFISSNFNDDNLETYDIYLYGTDGVVSEFLPEGLGGEFKHVFPTDPHLFEPFIDLCSRRWSDSYKELIKRSL